MKRKQTGKTNIFLGIVIVMVVVAGVLAVVGKNNNVVLEPLTAEEIERQNVEAVRINRMIYDIDLELERLKKADKATNQGKNLSMLEKLKTNLQLVTDNYESLLDLRYNGAKVNTEEEKFQGVLETAQHGKIEEIDESLTQLLTSLRVQNSALFVTSVTAAGPSISSSVPATNEAPTSGYRRQKVTAGGRSYLVDIIAADLNSTKVVVDTASDGTCGNNCPVLPLASYVGRSGAYAGINGSYFCPDTYPSCANKKNSFDTLVMNKNKVYFNSDNNVYSTVPAAVFGPGWARFVSASRDWGRDTGVDAVIANRPLLLLDGNIMFGGGGESKENIRGNRSFVGSAGNMAYIGIVRSASVAETAVVLQSMGLKNALNLDNGGSTALWSGGYKAGPGRRIPNAILFVRR